MGAVERYQLARKDVIELQPLAPPALECGAEVAPSVLNVGLERAQLGVVGAIDVWSRLGRTDEVLEASDFALDGLFEFLRVHSRRVVDAREHFGDHHGRRFLLWLDDRLKEPRTFVLTRKLLQVHTLRSGGVLVHS